MRTLFIACGNPLRRDDSVAHEAISLLSSVPDSRTLSVLQLTPELAAEISGFDTVVFLDADQYAVRVNLTPVPVSPPAPALSHVSGPGEIVALARSLYGFIGDAWCCRIPAFDLTAGEGLSSAALTFAKQAAHRLELLALPSGVSL